jgi:hypothetical protein
MNSHYHDEAIFYRSAPQTDIPFDKAIIGGQIDLISVAELIQDEIQTQVYNQLLPHPHRWAALCNGLNPDLHIPRESAHNILLLLNRILPPHEAPTIADIAVATKLNRHEGRLTLALQTPARNLNENNQAKKKVVAHILSVMDGNPDAAEAEKIFAFLNPEHSLPSDNENRYYFLDGICYQEFDDQFGGNHPFLMPFLLAEYINSWQ